MNAPTKALTTFKGQLAKNKKTYRALLRATDDETMRYLAEATEAISANPALLEAHRGSLHQAIGTAAAMNLSLLPVLGEAWLIPRRRNLGTYDQPRWVEWVNFQIGYKGLVKLAHRSDEIASIFVEVVYRGEHYVYRGGTDPGIDHAPDDDKRSRMWDDIVAAYAVVFLHGSDRPTFVHVSRTELEDIRDGTKTKYKECSDTWRDHPEAMCKKTALIRIAKLLPRVDKLRDYHRAAGHELALEGGRVTQLSESNFDLDDARPSLTERVMETDPKESRRWQDAVKHFGKVLGVTPDELLAHLGVESPSEIDDAGFDELEELFGSISRRETTVDAVFRGGEQGGDVDGQPNDSPAQDQSAGDETKDDDIPF